MKSMKFLALSLLTIVGTASAKIDLSTAIVRDETVKTGQNLILELDQREMCYQDETTYLEAELIEETAESAIIQFTVATKNESGAFMVRGLPKLPIDLKDLPNTASLRCEGPGESFTLVATVHTLNPNVQALVVAE